MPTPGEHKTVQARILEYAEAIGWTFVSQKEVEQRRGFNPETPVKDRANPSSPTGYAGARVRLLIVKRKRRFRGFPDTAFRPGIPRPERFIARTAPLSNLKFP
jgi:hypothetical protein